MARYTLGGMDDYFVATSQTAQGAAAYDDDGRLIPSGAQTTIEFYGKVMDEPSNKRALIGKYRDVRAQAIVCDSESIENLTIDFTLQREGGTRTYSIIDIYDSQFKWMSEVVINSIE